jgi:hypothetical protein
MQQERERMGDWTTNELAEAAGVTAAYIRQLLLADKLKGAYKRGRDWLIPDTVARRWLDNRSK